MELLLAKLYIEINDNFSKSDKQKKVRRRLTKQKIALITFYSGFLQTLLDVLQSGLPSLSERQLQRLRMASTSYEICCSSVTTVKLLALLIKRYRFLWQQSL